MTDLFASTSEMEEGHLFTFSSFYEKIVSGMSVPIMGQFEDY